VGPEVCWEGEWERAGKGGAETGEEGGNYRGGHTPAFSDTATGSARLPCHRDADSSILVSSQAVLLYPVCGFLCAPAATPMACCGSLQRGQRSKSMSESMAPTYPFPGLHKPQDDISLAQYSCTAPVYSTDMSLQGQTVLYSR